MATKIYCAVIDCEFNNKDGRCIAKTVCLSDHSISTTWEGRQRFQRCKTYQKSQEYIEMEEAIKPYLDKLKDKMSYE